MGLRAAGLYKYAAPRQRGGADAAGVVDSPGHSMQVADVRVGANSEMGCKRHAYRAPTDYISGNRLASIEQHVACSGACPGIGKT